MMKLELAEMIKKAVDCNTPDDIRAVIDATTVQMMAMFQSVLKDLEGRSISDKS